MDDSTRHLSYVYLMRAEDGTHKIGRSDNPDKRATNGDLLKYKPVVIHRIPTFVASALERGLHRLFAEKRLTGEWFDLAPDDIAFIVEIGQCDDIYSAPPEVPMIRPQANGRTRITFDVPELYRRALNVYAAMKGRSVGEIITHMIEQCCPLSVDIVERTMEEQTAKDNTPPPE